MKSLSGPDDPRMMWNVAKAFALVLFFIVLAVLSSVYVAVNVI